MCLPSIVIVPYSIWESYQYKIIPNYYLHFQNELMIQLETPCTSLMMSQPWDYMLVEADPFYKKIIGSKFWKRKRKKKVINSLNNLWISMNYLSTNHAMQGRIVSMFRGPPKFKKKFKFTLKFLKIYIWPPKVLKFFIYTSKFLKIYI